MATHPKKTWIAENVRLQQHSPDVIRIGPAVLLVRIDVVGRWLGLVTDDIRSFLERCHIPVVSTPNGEYVARHALETCLFVLLDLGGRSFDLSPSSPEADFPDDLTDNYLAPLDDPTHPLHVRMAMTAVAYNHLSRTDVERTLEDWGNKLLKSRGQRKLKRGRPPRKPPERV